MEKNIKYKKKYIIFIQMSKNIKILINGIWI